MIYRITKSNDKLHIVYYDNQNERIIYLFSTDNGVSWSSPLVILDQNGNAIQFNGHDVININVIENNNTLYIVYVEQEWNNFYLKCLCGGKYSAEYEITSINTYGSENPPPFTTIELFESEEGAYFPKLLTSYNDNIVEFELYYSLQSETTLLSGYDPRKLDTDKFTMLIYRDYFGSILIDYYHKVFDSYNTFFVVTDTDDFNISLQKDILYIYTNEVIYYTNINKLDTWSALELPIYGDVTIDCNGGIVVLFEDDIIEDVGFEEDGIFYEYWMMTGIANKMIYTPGVEKPFNKPVIFGTTLFQEEAGPQWSGT